MDPDTPKYTRTHQNRCHVCVTVSLYVVHIYVHATKSKSNLNPSDGLWFQFETAWALINLLKTLIIYLTKSLIITSYIKVFDFPSSHVYKHTSAL